MAPRLRRALPWLVAACAVLPFLPALRAPFLGWDDLYNLAENDRWRGFGGGNLRWMLTTTLGGPYQPLSWLSYGLDFSLWGDSPAMMRLTNLLLHGASAAVFYLLFDELARKAGSSAPERERRAVAACAALFWAAHPLRVESVVWLTERRDVLSGLFYLLAALVYVREPKKPLPPFGLFCLAVLAKASAITLPLTLLVLDAWPLKRRAYAEKLPYIAVAAAAGAGGLAAQRLSGSLKGLMESGLAERLALSVYSLWWYAWKTVLPWGLSPYHAVPSGFGLTSVSVLLGGACTLGAAVAAYALRRREPAVPAALAQYALGLSPMLGLARFGHHLVAERYSYLPGLGLAALGGMALLAARRRKEALPVAAGALIFMALLTARASSWWSGDEALWKRAIAVAPGAYLPRANLAAVLRGSGRLEEARAMERAAVELVPDAAEPLNNLGFDEVVAGRFSAAEPLLRRAAASARAPAATRALARYNLAAALQGLKRDPEALAELQEAEKLAPADAKILNNLGTALLRAGRPKEAEPALRHAAKLLPSWPPPSYNLGNALAELGRHAEAAAAYDEASRLDPRFVQAWVNGGNELARLGRLKEAAERYRRALDADPSNALARRNLAVVRPAGGRR